MTLLILYGALAIGVSFLCSMLEACLLSLPRSYVETLVEQGQPAGKTLREMKINIDRPLAAILTLNTIAHTIGAAGVGAQAAVVFGSAWVGAVSAVMTLLILVVSEIIPKTLGAVHAKTIAPAVAAITRVMMIGCLPFIVPLEWINRAIGGRRHQPRMSRAELLATIRLGETSGAIGHKEYEIASNLMKLSTIRLQEVHTPRSVVFTLPAVATVGEVIAQHRPIRFARIPVFGELPEDIVGYVARFAIDAAHHSGESDRTLQTMTKPLMIFPAQATVGQTLDRLLRAHEHMAKVVDESGTFQGIVTLEDLLESLLGAEIIDETDPVTDMRELAERKSAEQREQR